MKIKEIGHLAFTCKDLEASIRFYRDQLGFTNKFSIYYDEMLAHIRKDNPDAKGGFVDFIEANLGKKWISYFDIGNGQFFELFDAGSATIPCVPGGEHLNYSHVSLVVEDIHAAHAELIEKGVPVDTPPQLGLEGTWQMWSHDPDGNKIEFMQYTKDSWQIIGH